MSNHNKVYIIYLDNKPESVWYSEENMLSEYQDFLDDGYTEDQVHYREFYINDFNE